MQRVTEIGGFFMKCRDRERMKSWYAEVLGLDGEYGVVFQWRHPDDPGRMGHTVLSFSKDDTRYFDPSRKPFMINYRVNNLVHLQRALAADGHHPEGTNEEYDFGQFGWMMDPEGNKLEFWEPVDALYGKYYKPLPFIHGIGGVFFEAENAERLQNWYARHLHLKADEYGIRFDWLRPDSDIAVWQEWAVYSREEARRIFAPSDKPFMINFVVRDMDAMLAQLARHNVALLTPVEQYTYGRFAWILDPEGHKIELWQP